jgi:hypothetical protein
MTPEVVLFYSPNAFGTVDAIAYRYRLLRINDLKTGVTRVSFHQLHVYAALFCLEYEIDPFSLRGMELRLYKDGTVLLDEPSPAYIKGIMDKIVYFDGVLNELREEVA